MFLLKWKNDSIARIVFLMAGIFTLASVVLGIYVNEWFFLLGAFVGLMQIIFALTGFCPMVIMLRKTGKKCYLENL